jgi:uncharacterized Ntn-hydrolase superfamily protein
MRVIDKFRALRWAPVLAIIVFIIPSLSHATFSIVAVDTVTGAVGGAGASCIDNCQIITDVVEGIGAVHTQAYWNSQNQSNAHNLLVSGITPDSIMSWLENNDAQGSSAFRQYGAVTLVGPGSSAAYTGPGCSPWAGHVTGPGYAAQGNILLGAEIVDTIVFAYLNTEGPLEDRLMAALEAANVPGADTRCFPDKPAISAFIKVVHIGDGGTPYLYEVVTNTTDEQNPLDSLRVRYEAWKALRLPDADSSRVELSPDAMPAGCDDTAFITVTPLNYAGQAPSEGAEVSLEHTGEGELSPVTDNGDGTFSAFLAAPLSAGVDTVVATVTAGGEAVEATAQPVVLYFPIGDADNNGSINLLDVTHIINYLYKEGPPPTYDEAGDPDASGGTNLLDVTYIINYLYKFGPAPLCPQ